MKLVGALFLVMILLAGCSSSVKEVNGLIEEENYSKAVKLIDEYDLLNKETKQEDYNYQNVIFLKWVTNSI